MSMVVGLEKICPVCDKYFIAQPGWAFKKQKKGKFLYFCRYNCLRKCETKEWKYE